MNSSSKNKLLSWLVILLLVANAATITMFWLGKKHPPLPPKGTPNEFLIKELKLDAKQQEQLAVLVKAHRQAAEPLRKKIKEAKDSFFDLLQQSSVTDSTRKVAAMAASAISEELDLLTLDHFQKIRALCTPEQQRKFDSIIHQVTSMMAPPQPNGPGGRPQGPPPEGPDGERPPLPGQ